MLREAENELIKKAMIFLWIIFAAFIWSLLITIILGVWMASEILPQLKTAPPDQILENIKPVIWAVCIIFILLSFIARKVMLNLKSGSLSSIITKYKIAVFVSLVISELVVFGGFALLVTGASLTIFVAFAVVSVVLMILHRPKRKELEELALAQLPKSYAEPGKPPLSRQATPKEQAMLTPTQQDTVFSAQMNKLWAIFVALMFSLIMIIATLHFAEGINEVKQSFAAEAPDIPLQTLQNIFFGAAIAIFIMSFIVRKIILGLKQKGSADKLVGTYMLAVLASLVLSEVIAFLGVALFFLGADYKTLYMFVAGAAVGMLLNIPRRAELEQYAAAQKSQSII